MRYSLPYASQEIYSNLAEVESSCDRIIKEHNVAANRIQR